MDAIIAKYPESKYFIIKYCYTCFLMTFSTGRKTSSNKHLAKISCSLITAVMRIVASHSFLPVIAIRDIKSGEELTYDYQCNGAFIRRKIDELNTKW